MINHLFKKIIFVFVLAFLFAISTASPRKANKLNDCLDWNKLKKTYSSSLLTPKSNPQLYSFIEKIFRPIANAQTGIFDGTAINCLIIIDDPATDMWTKISKGKTGVKTTPKYIQQTYITSGLIGDILEDANELGGKFIEKSKYRDAIKKFAGAFSHSLSEHTQFDSIEKFNSELIEDMIGNRIYGQSTNLAIDANATKLSEKAGFGRDSVFNYFKKKFKPTGKNSSISASLITFDPNENIRLTALRANLTVARHERGLPQTKNLDQIKPVSKSLESEIEKWVVYKIKQPGTPEEILRRLENLGEMNSQSRRLLEFNYLVRSLDDMVEKGLTEKKNLQSVYKCYELIAKSNNKILTKNKILKLFGKNKITDKIILLKEHDTFLKQNPFFKQQEYRTWLKQNYFKNIKKYALNQKIIELNRILPSELVFKDFQDDIANNFRNIMNHDVMAKVEMKSAFSHMDRLKQNKIYKKYRMEKKFAQNTPFNNINSVISEFPEHLQPKLMKITHKIILEPTVTTVAGLTGFSPNQKAMLFYLDKNNTTLFQDKSKFEYIWKNKGRFGIMDILMPDNRIDWKDICKHLNIPYENAKMELVTAIKNFTRTDEYSDLISDIKQIKTKANGMGPERIMTFDGILSGTGKRKIAPDWVDNSLGQFLTGTHNNKIQKDLIKINQMIKSNPIDEAIPPRSLQEMAYRFVAAPYFDENPEATHKYIQSTLKKYFLMIENPTEKARITPEKLFNKYVELVDPANFKRGEGFKTKQGRYSVHLAKEIDELNIPAREKKKFLEYIFIDKAIDLKSASSDLQIQQIQEILGKNGSSHDFIDRIKKISANMDLFVSKNTNKIRLVAEIEADYFNIINRRSVFFADNIDSHLSKIPAGSKKKEIFSLAKILFDPYSKTERKTLKSQLLNKLANIESGISSLDFFGGDGEKLLKKILNAGFDNGINDDLWREFDTFIEKNIKISMSRLPSSISQTDKKQLLALYAQKKDAMLKTTKGFFDSKEFQITENMYRSSSEIKNTAEIQRLKRRFIKTAKKIKLSAAEKFKLFEILTATGPTIETDSLIKNDLAKIINNRNKTHRIVKKDLAFLEKIATENKIYSAETKASIVKKIMFSKVKPTKGRAGGSEYKLISKNMKKYVDKILSTPTAAKDRLLEELGWAYGLRGNELNKLVTKRKSTSALALGKSNYANLASALGSILDSMDADNKYKLLEYISKPEMTEFPSDVLHAVKNIMKNDPAILHGQALSKMEFKPFINMLGEQFALKFETFKKTSSHFERIPLADLIINAGEHSLMDTPKYHDKIIHSIMNISPGSKEEKALLTYLKLTAPEERSITLSYQLSKYDKSKQGLRHYFSIFKTPGDKLAQQSYFWNIFGPKSKNMDLAESLDNTKPISRAEIEKILKRDLTPDEFSKIAYIDDIIGSASIKTVPKVTLTDGRQVALLIQKPYAREQVQTNMKLAKKLLKDLDNSGVDIPKGLFEFLVEDLELQLYDELDMRNEAKRIKTFKKIYNGLNKKFADQLNGFKFEVPGPVDGFKIRENIMFVDLATGDSWRKAPNAIKDELGEIIVKSSLEPFYEKGWSESDRHAGNFFIDKKKKTIYVLDVAQGTKFKKRGLGFLSDDRYIFSQFVRHLYESDAEGIVKFAKKMGKVDKHFQKKSVIMELKKIINGSNDLDWAAKRIKVIDTLAKEGIRFKPKFTMNAIKGHMTVAAGEYVKPERFEEIVHQYIEDLLKKKKFPLTIIDEAKGHLRKNCWRTLLSKIITK